MLSIRLSSETIDQIQEALDQTSNEPDWTEMPPIARDSAGDYAVLHFLGGARVPMPKYAFNPDREEWEQQVARNVKFVCFSRRYVRQLLAERHSLLREIEEWKLKAADYRDILTKQGRGPDAADTPAD